MLVLSRDAYRAIVAHAEDDAPREACGVLAGRIADDTATVRTAYPTENVADAPRVAYVIDPEDQFEVMETIEAHDQSVVGFYHSHPAGPAGPSRTDAERATWPDRHYLVVSLARRPPTLDAWRFTDDGFVADDVRVAPPGPE
ncbi:MAG: desampylase [Halanaeroarchaeum sp.]